MEANETISPEVGTQLLFENERVRFGICDWHRARVRACTGTSTTTYT